MTDSEAPDSSPQPAAVVLVHGAWHGAWCWQPVMDRLSTAGVSAFAIDLPGHGSDLGPSGDLHQDAARVRLLLDTLEPPVVLVGHSYGGAVITEAGDHASVAHLVYLAALALDWGESCLTVAAGEAQAATIAHEGRPDLAAGLVPGPDDSLTLDRSLAAQCLYEDCDDETTGWALDRLGAQPLITLQQTPEAVAWRQRSSTYVVCANDLTVHPALQELLANRCTTRVEWDCGHSPFLSHPTLVADLLTELATAVRST
jgi:pimeloyl-ACP methyl ester carboxylesterase